MSSSVARSATAWRTASSCSAATARSANWPESNTTRQAYAVRSAATVRTTVSTRNKVRHSLPDDPARRKLRLLFELEDELVLDVGELLGRQVPQLEHVVDLHRARDRAEGRVDQVRQRAAQLGVVLEGLHVAPRAPEGQEDLHALGVEPAPLPGQQRRLLQPLRRVDVAALEQVLDRAVAEHRREELLAHRAPAYPRRGTSRKAVGSP